MTNAASTLNIPICMDVEEAAAYLGVAFKHVYYLLYLGRIDGWKIRNTWRLFRGSVEAYAHERNDGRTVQNAPRDHDDQGSGRVLALLGNHDPAYDLGETDSGVYGRRRMEHRPAGLIRVPSKALEPMIEARRTREVVQLKQLEFAF